MAFSVTLRYGSSGGGVTSTQWTSSTFTPAASSLLLAGYGGVSTGSGGASQHNSQTLAVATNTGGWGTHTQVIEVEPVDGPDWDSYGGQWPCAYNISRVAVPASPGSGQVSSAVTFVNGGQNFDTSMAVIDVTGHNASSPIVQAKSAQASYQDTSSGHNLNVTLDTAPTVGNLLVCFAVASCDSGGGFSTPYAGSGRTFTALHNAGGIYAQNYVGYRVVQSGDSSTVQIDDLGQTVGGGIIFVIEVAAESGGPTTHTADASATDTTTATAAASRSAIGSTTVADGDTGTATASRAVIGGTSASDTDTVTAAATATRPASSSVTDVDSVTASVATTKVVGIPGGDDFADTFDYSAGDLHVVSSDWNAQGGATQTGRTLVPWNATGSGGIEAERSLNEPPYLSYSSAALIDRVFGSDQWMEVDFQVPATVNESWDIEICLRFRDDATTGYLASIYNWLDATLGYGGVAVGYFPSGGDYPEVVAWEEVANEVEPFDFTPGQTYTFRAVISGSTVTAYLDGVQMAQWTDDGTVPYAQFDSGRMGLIGYSENYNESWINFDSPQIVDVRAGSLGVSDIDSADPSAVLTAVATATVADADTVTAAADVTRPVDAAVTDADTVTAGLFSPLSIPWQHAFWADQPGFTPPADGADLPAAPDNLGTDAATTIPANVWGRYLNATDGPNWVTDMGGTGKPAVSQVGIRGLQTIMVGDFGSPRTVVVVGRAKGTADADLFDMTSSRSLIDTSSGTWRLYAGNVAMLSGGPASDTDVHLFVAEFGTGVSNDQGSLQVDDGTPFTGSVGADVGGNTVHVGYSPGGSGNVDGTEVAFVGVIDRELTQQEKDDLWAWYQAEYPSVSAVVAAPADADTVTATADAARPVVAAPADADTVTATAEVTRPVGVTPADVDVVTAAAEAVRPTSATPTDVDAVTASADATTPGGGATVLGTHYSASGGAATRTITLDAASTPGKALLLVAKHQGTVGLNEIGVAGNVAGFVNVQGIEGGSGRLDYFLLHADSHTESMSQITLTFGGVDRSVAAVVLELDGDVANLSNGYSDAGATNYTTTSWTTEQLSAQRNRSVAVFIASMDNQGTLPSFDATGFDKGHTEVADTGGGGVHRMWVATAEDLDFTNENVTMTTTDSTGLYQAEGLHIYYDINPPTDVVNRETLRDTDDSSTAKSFSWGFTPTAGNELLVIAQAAATFSTPSGWTRVSPEYLGDYAFVAFTKTSDGTEAGISWTQNGARVAAGMVWEFPAGSVIGSPLTGPLDDGESYPSTMTGPLGPYAERRVWVLGLTSGPGILLTAPAGDVTFASAYAAPSITAEAAGVSGGDVTIPAGETRDAAWLSDVATAPFRAFRFAVTVPSPTPTATADDVDTVTATATVATSTAATVTDVDTITASTPVSNPIPAENALPGVSSPNAGFDLAGTGNGEVGYLGFSRSYSVNAGDTIDFAVDGVNAAEIGVYRIGHYGGDGKRLVTTLTNTGTAQSGGTTVADSNGGTTMAAWSTTASWAVPADTVSGMFVAAVRNSSGTAYAWIPFVVRNDSRDADIVVMTSDSTWAAAYNYFGDQGSEKTGKSVYGSGGALGDITTRCHFVSYDRPIVSRPPSPGGNVVNHWDAQELALIDWLEENGYDVKYIGSYDLDQQNITDVIGNAGVFISVGHDEYWSQGMRDNIEAFRDAGGHVIFMAGNHIFWRIRWAPDGRGFWCYKDTMPGPGAHVAGDPLDPVSWTGTWKDTRRPDPPGPEHEYTTTGDSFRMNGINNLTMTVDAATYGSSPFWRDTTVATGTNLVVAEVIGFEANQYQPPDSGAVRLAQTTHNIDGSVAGPNGENYSGNGDLDWSPVMFYATAASGVTVGFGTTQWQWGLSDRHERGSGSVANVQMRQATTNLLYDLGATAGTLQVDLTEPTPVSLASYGVTYTGTDPYAPVSGQDGSIWYPATISTASAPTDPTAYSLATRFTSESDGTIQRIWYWKQSAQDIASTTVYLTDFTNSTILGQTTVDWGTETGWVYADLPSPVSITGDGATVYGVCLVVPAAFNYTYEAAAFGSGSVVNGSLTALGGSWVAGSTPTTTGWNAVTTSYYVDVAFVAASTEVEATPGDVDSVTAEGVAVRPAGAATTDVDTVTATAGVVRPAAATTTDVDTVTATAGVVRPAAATTTDVDTVTAAADVTGAAEASASVDDTDTATATAVATAVAVTQQVTDLDSVLAAVAGDALAAAAASDVDTATVVAARVQATSATGQVDIDTVTVVADTGNVADVAATDADTVTAVVDVVPNARTTTSDVDTVAAEFDVTRFAVVTPVDVDTASLAAVASRIGAATIADVDTASATSTVRGPITVGSIHGRAADTASITPRAADAASITPRTVGQGTITGRTP